MRAACIHAYGGPAALHVEERPAPEPGPRDVLIEVHATSVNPVDCKLRQGAMRGVLRYPMPLVLGFDVAGVVLAVGSECTRLRPGDAVYASPDQHQIGTYAELAVVQEAHTAKQPAGLSHTEAASLPLAGLTAWDCLEPLQAGQRALILAGSGGVGSLAIQLAKERGAHVITTCSPRNDALVRSLGADEVIDYTRQDFRDVLSGVDLVLDALGSWSACRQVLRRGGQLRTIVSGLPPATYRWGPYLGPLTVGLKILGFQLTSLLQGVRTKNVLRQASAAHLDELSKRIAAGTLRPVLDRVMPLEEVVAAHRYSESGRARGKIVLAVR